MVHEMLDNRVILERPFDYECDPAAKAIIDLYCRRLVMTMRSIELDGIMERSNIEKCVIACLTNAEALYYSLTKEEFESLLEREVANEKARRRSKGY